MHSGAAAGADAAPGMLLRFCTADAMHRQSKRQPTPTPDMIPARGPQTTFFVNLEVANLMSWLPESTRNR